MLVDSCPGYILSNTCPGNERPSSSKRISGSNPLRSSKPPVHSAAEFIIIDIKIHFG